MLTKEESMDRNIQTFIKEVCSHCKNDNCERGIYTAKYNDMIVTKCCDYIRNNENCADEQTREIVKYYRHRAERRKEV